MGDSIKGKTATSLQENQKLLIEAFKYQNEEFYDQCFDQNLIRMFDRLQMVEDFHTRFMPLLKEERELVSEQQYKEFIRKNQKGFSRNFEENYYRALLMQELQQKKIKQAETKDKNTHKSTSDSIYCDASQQHYGFQPSSPMEQQ